MRLFRRSCRLVLRVVKVFLEEDSLALSTFLGFLVMVASLIAGDFERVLSVEMDRRCVVSWSVLSISMVSLSVVCPLFGVLGEVPD